ncbi:MAG TPA: hypothetical protein VMN36_06820 [Verrucomicrobiales bacterium]|nr:hypothetical protein [Verrucomicrobiales bacterium]
MHNSPGSAEEVDSATGRVAVSWDGLARRAGRRLVLIAWFRECRRWLIWAAIAAGGTALAAGWLGGGLAARLAWAGLVMGGTAAGLLLAAALRRPGPARALAAWDRAANGRGLLLSAWSFAGRNPAGAGVAGEALHLRRAEAAAPEAVRSLPRILPLPRPGWRLLWLAALVAGAAVPFSRSGSSDPDDRALGEGTAEAALREGMRLEMAAEVLEAIEEEPDPGAEEARRRAAQELAGAVKTLENAEGKTARALLSELEARAGALEELARGLADNTAWLSPEVVAELRRHVDTGDLADAIDAKRAEPAAEESERLATGLDAGAGTESGGLPGRLGDALRTSLARAVPEDRERMVGQHLFSAESKLAALRVREAAGEFRALADAFRRLAKRLEGRKRMEDLAEAVREAGSAVAGPDGAVGPLQTTEAPAAGSEGAGESGAGQGLAEGEAQPGLSVLPAPGPEDEGRPLRLGSGARSTDEGELSPGSEKAFVFGEDDEEGELGAPDGMLLAPIPGAALSSGSGTTPGSAANPPDPNASSASVAEAAQTAVVDVEESGSGGSKTRKVAGNSEAGGESGPAPALSGRAFLTVEEAALDDLPVPAGRRTEIRLYFEELKRRLDGGQ